MDGAAAARRHDREIFRSDGEEQPDSWNLRTADLLSRLRLAPTVAIGPPDDDLMRAVLVKLLIERQLVVEASVISYIAVRLERSLDAARLLVDGPRRRVVGATKPDHQNDCAGHSVLNGGRGEHQRLGRSRARPARGDDVTARQIGSLGLWHR
jgi:hypothetical protein